MTSKSIPVHLRRQLGPWSRIILASWVACWEVVSGVCYTLAICWAGQIIGSRQTFFAFQATRFADIYSSSFLNLGNFPTHFLFRAPHQLVIKLIIKSFQWFQLQMPHEQPTSEGLNSPGPMPSSINMKLVGQNLICIDHDLDEEVDKADCFEIESIP